MNNYREVRSYLSHATITPKEKRRNEIAAERAAEYAKKDVSSQYNTALKAQMRAIGVYNKKADDIKSRISSMRSKSGVSKSAQASSAITNAINAEKQKWVTAAKELMDVIDSNPAKGYAYNAVKGKDVVRADNETNPLGHGQSSLNQMRRDAASVSTIERFDRAVETRRKLLESALSHSNFGDESDMHSSLEEEYMNSEYTEINAYLQHGLFDIFKSKPKYNSAGSAAGMPSNIHLGDSYNPTAKASAIQDEIVRMTKKLAEYENGEVKAKADYDRYKKLVKETKAKLSDLEKARANAVTQSVNSNTKQTTVTSSVPNKTRLVRTNPIFDRDVANLRKKR